MKNTLKYKDNEKDALRQCSNEWVAVDDALPMTAGFYLIYSTEKEMWTKALYKMGEFHTIESDIDGYITHWKIIVKPAF